MDRVRFEAIVGYDLNHMKEVRRLIHVGGHKVYVYNSYRWTEVRLHGPWLLRCLSFPETWWFYVRRRSVAFTDYLGLATACENIV
jgi:hypothetical protein